MLPQLLNYLLAILLEFILARLPPRQVTEGLSRIHVHEAAGAGVNAVIVYYAIPLVTRVVNICDLPIHRLPITDTEHRTGDASFSGGKEVSHAQNNGVTPRLQTLFEAIALIGADEKVPRE